MFKPVFASILAVGATAVLAAGALAAGPTGPQHYNLTTPQVCFDKGPFHGTDSLHAHQLLTSNLTVLQEMGIHDVSTQTSGGQTCTFSQDLHVTQVDPATGTAHIQYDNFSAVCV